MRVINIDTIDLNLFPFDYDLTLAILLANADGTVYHRYGGRSHLSPMNMDGLVELIEKGLSTHHDYIESPNPPRSKPPQYLPELINERLKGRIKPVFGCFHCHFAREAQQYVALEAGEWTPNEFWIWPLPKRLGLVMNQKRQYLVEEVLPQSAADRSGIRIGDELETLGHNRILSKYDIQHVLNERRDSSGQLAYSLRRDGRLINGTLNLEDHWKVGDPKDYLWRVRNVYTEHMIKFLPTPGFIGNRLTVSESTDLGLEGKPFALKVSQLNRGAHLSGIRSGDVILSAGNQSKFGSVRDFYAWCESLRRSNRDIKMRLLRNGVEMNVMIGIDRLNYSRAEKAPRVNLGFIVQELPRQGGLRVGNVTDDCSAEKTGIVIGDRIVSVEGKQMDSKEELTRLLNHKAPGDLLTIDVKRNNKALQFSFVLPGEDERESSLATLSDPVTANGQRVECVISMKLPRERHIYSVNNQGMGQPTRLEFRGRGYRLIGDLIEPPPKEMIGPNNEPSWILEGDVSLAQMIEITDHNHFQLLLHVYAQVCDAQSCHEFRAMVSSDGSSRPFREFRGRFERQPLIGLLGERVSPPGN